jgi:hypothetical protein
MHPCECDNSAKLLADALCSRASAESSAATIQTIADKSTRVCSGRAISARCIHCNPTICELRKGEHVIPVFQTILALKSKLY